MQVFQYKSVSTRRIKHVSELGSWIVLILVSYLNGCVLILMMISILFPFLPLQGLKLSTQLQSLRPLYELVYNPFPKMCSLHILYKNHIQTQFP